MDYKSNFQNFQNFINKKYINYRYPVLQNINACNTNFKFNLTLTQQFISDYYKPENPNGMLLFHSVGSGKCHGKDTKIIMYDSSIKKVQDILEGDLLMGDNSTPRTVLSVTSGKAQLFKVSDNYSYNDSYTCNEDHILCLKLTKVPFFIQNKKEKYFSITYVVDKKLKENKLYYDKNTLKYKKEEALQFIKHRSFKENILEISIKDYLILEKTIQRNIKGYRVPIVFSDTDILPIDPYILGNWLGNVAFQDNQEIKNKLQIGKDKYIPTIYKKSSINDRIKLLLGFIDNSGQINKNNIIIRRKNEKLIDDLLFLCRSIGLVCYKHTKIINTNNIKTKKTFDIVLYISYNSLKNNGFISDLSYDIEITPINIDDYYGFTLSGNGRYILSDFTVTHNTNTAVNLLQHFEKYGWNTLWITRTTLKKDIEKALNVIPLQHQLPIFSYKQFSNICKRKGENYKKLMKRALKKNNETKDPFYKTIIIIDEAHKLYTKDLKAQELHDINVIQDGIYSSYQNKNNGCKVILMTATPITENPEEVIKLLNLVITDPKKRIIPEEFIEIDGSITESNKEKIKEKIMGIVSYLDVSKDKSKFAQPVITNVLVPVSVEPKIKNKEECSNNYYLCKELGYSTKECREEKNICNKKVKQEQKMVKNDRNQIKIFKEKCGFEL